MREKFKKIAIVLLFVGLIALFIKFAQIISPGNNSFFYNFSNTGTLYEAGNGTDTTSPFWWLDSGAKMLMQNGVGSTIIGPLSTGDPWRITYSQTNATDTDGGYHPQNIFRLLTRSQWLNARAELYFKVDALNLSTSSNRNESNGLLLFGRYQDEYNLYYAGIRVDGYAVIKKKIGGVYYTLALNQVFPGPAYDASTSPNLIPVGTWIGLRMTMVNIGHKKVSLQLYMDQGKTGKWTPIAQATDDSLLTPGYAGIRTDFMDVEFDDYLIAKM